MFLQLLLGLHVCPLFWASSLFLVSIAEASVSSFTCDFDKNLCEYSTKPNDPLLWKRHQGTAKGQRPDTDHTGSGSFAYIDTYSSGGGGGKTASLRSGSIEYDPGQFCLQFWYHVYGDSLGTLKVGLELQGNDQMLKPLWHSRPDIHRNAWQFAEAEFTLTDDEARIVFTGMLGTGNSSGIAIDDVRTLDGHCSLPGDCHFDDICSWTNVQYKEFNWTLCHNCTTGKTGPSSDHTGNGNFLYIESTATEKGLLATLESSDFITPQESVCFQFYYYLQGDTFGTLHVSSVTYNRRSDDGVDKTQKVVWQLTDGQGGGWKKATIPLTSPLESFKIQIVAVSGSDNDGGFIALDDTSFTNKTAGLCPLTPSRADPSDAHPESGTPWMTPVFIVLGIIIVVAIIIVVVGIVVRKRRAAESDRVNLEAELEHKPTTAANTYLDYY